MANGVQGTRRRQANTITTGQQFSAPPPPPPQPRQQQTGFPGGTQTQFNQFLRSGQQPSMADFFNLIAPQSLSGPPSNTLIGAFARPGFQIGNVLNAAGRPLGALGLSGLGEILASQGRTDPQAMNQQLAAIQRGTQSQQQATQGLLQGLGLQGSGVGAALQAAQGVAGQGQQAALRAAEAQQAEQRRRSDLDLLRRLVFDPSLQAGAAALGVPIQPSQPGGTERAMQAAIPLIAAMLCWAARELYGADDPRWLLARHYILTRAPARFVGWYATHGPALAAGMRAQPVLKRIFRPMFDRMVAAVRREHDA